jgi:diamine N-acetyltransferase
MTDLRLEPLSAATVVAANSLTLKPGQEQYAQPVSHSMWESAVSQSTTWPRVVLDGDDVVGFIVGNFDADNDQEELRSCLWRLNVSGTAQGKGIGRFAVHALAAEARTRGFERLTVMFETGADGPEPFFTAIGFEIVGETPFGEAFAAISL